MQNGRARHNSRETPAITELEKINSGAQVGRSLLSNQARSADRGQRYDSEKTSNNAAIEGGLHCSQGRSETTEIATTKGYEQIGVGIAPQPGAE